MLNDRSHKSMVAKDAERGAISCIILCTSKIVDKHKLWLPLQFVKDCVHRRHRQAIMK